MDIRQLITGLLVVVCFTCLAMVGLPYVTGEIKAERRKDQFTLPRRARNDRVTDTANRRKQITESLNELEQKGKTKRVSLETKLAQAGLDEVTKKTRAHLAEFKAVGEFLGAIDNLVVAATQVGEWVRSNTHTMRTKL